MPKSKKTKNLREMQMTDGKVYNKHGVKSINELLKTEKQLYPTNNASKYEEYLNELNTSDLQRHATEVGVLPNQDREVLIRRLQKEFFVKNSHHLNQAQPVAFTKEISSKVARILSEGR